MVFYWKTLEKVPLCSWPKVKIVLMMILILAASQMALVNYAHGY